MAVVQKLERKVFWAVGCSSLIELRESGSRRCSWLRVSLSGQKSDGGNEREVALVYERGVVRLGNLGMSNRAGLRHSALPTSASLTRLRPARCWAYRHRDPHSVSLLVQAPQCAIRRKRLVARKELLDVMNDMIVCMQNEEGLNASMLNLQ
jgi:hypothetical protein